MYVRDILRGKTVTDTEAAASAIERIHRTGSKRQAVCRCSRIYKEAV